MSGGWPLSATLDILKYEELEGQIKVFFSFIESESACCSCIGSDAQWLRYGDCSFSGFSLSEVKGELEKAFSKEECKMDQKSDLKDLKG